MKEIYQQTAEEVLERVESRESGLTDEQVRRSREKCGWNELAEGKKKSILQIFFEQYKDFLVLILIASAVISGMLGDVESAAVIVIVITINAILLSSPGCIALSSVSKTNQPCAPPRTLPKMKSSISKPIMPMYAHIAKVLNML